MQGFLGELIGTMTLILLGNGVVAGVSLKGSYAENGGWIVITTAWGLAVICARHRRARRRQQRAPESGRDDRRRHRDRRLEPGAGVHRRAVLGCAARRRARVAALPAALGARPTTRPASARASARRRPCGMRRRTCSARSSARSCSCSSRRRSRPTICRRTGSRRGSGRSSSGLLVWGIGLSLGGPTGYAINPARDLGPRIAHALLPIAGKGSSGWDYAAIPVLGPVIGAVLAGLAVVAVGI